MMEEEEAAAAEGEGEGEGEEEEGEEAPAKIGGIESEETAFPIERCT
jgi:hypothetical protein